MVKNSFRTDINGLRAVAVIAVILFHFGVSGFAGAFVGVDIFFVISGFLMTGIIVRGLENSDSKKFSIFSFYIARARRIIPALVVLCLTLFILGWFFIAPDDYSKLAREVDRALLFLSNNYYYKNSGYFDADSHERMLLHAWTLAVEWQFYIIYPLVLVALSKLGLKRLPYAITVLLLASFAWSVYKSYTEPNYAFYLLASRAWEMMLGGVVFYLSRTQLLSQYKSQFFYVGLACILASIFLYDPTIRWPGIPALLPTLGAAMIIFAGHHSAILANGPAQRLGDWSYSIYLWHWPLAVVLALMSIEGFTWWSVLCICLSVVLGWLSFVVVENPIRQYFTKKSNWLTLVIVLIVLAVILVAAEKIRKNKGYIDRISGDVYQILNAEYDRYHEMDKCHEKRKSKNKDTDCIYSGGEVAAIVMGDSHAMSMMPLVVEVYKDKQSSVLDLTASGCPVLEGVKSLEGTECNGFFEKNISKLDEFKNVPIYLSNRYSASLLGANEKSAKLKPNLYFNEIYLDFSQDYINEVYSKYIDSICTLTKNNPVYMFRPVPELIKHVPKTMGRAMLYRNEKVRVSVTREYYESRNEVANKMIDELADRCGVVPLEVAEYFCDNEYCYGDVEGQPVYFDDDHLNTKGALLLKGEIIKYMPLINK